MKRLTAFLGYLAAGLTIAVAVAAPFFWFGAFNSAAARTTLRIDPIYTGGELSHTIHRDGYDIVVYRPVPRRGLFGPNRAFVQMVWKPVSRLPRTIADQVDLNGDGKTDLIAFFDVPQNPSVEPSVTVRSLTAQVEPMDGVKKDSFACLIARVNDTIVLRVPMR
jgi:hypothetical protein